MKLSTLSEATGMEGEIRSIATGEVIHFQLPRGAKRTPVEVRMHGMRFEGYMTFEPIAVEKHDDVDVQMSVIIPSPPVSTEALDAPRAARDPSVRYDVDGAPMGVSEIKEAPEMLLREPIASREQRAKLEEQDQARAERAAGASRDVDGAPPAAGEPEILPQGSPPEERDPTAVPQYEGLASSRAREAEVEQEARAGKLAQEMDSEEPRKSTGGKSRRR